MLNKTASHKEQEHGLLKCNLIYYTFDQTGISCITETDDNTSEEHDVSSWVALRWRDFVIDVPEDGFRDLIQRFGAVLRQTGGKIMVQFIFTLYLW